MIKLVPRSSMAIGHPSTWDKCHGAFTQKSQANRRTHQKFPDSYISPIIRKIGLKV